MQYVHVLDQSMYFGTRYALKIVDGVIGLIEIALGLRLALLFLGANPGVGFVQWIYSLTGGLMQPFAGIFPAWHLGGGYVLDFSTLFAMIAYAFVGWLITYIVLMLFPPPIAADIK